MKLILISMAWWINWTVAIGFLKIQENCMQYHCITQKWQSSVMLVRLPSLVLIFLKTTMEMLWLWTASTTPKWSTTSFCRIYDENVCLSDVCGFSRMKRWSTQLEHQWTCFALSSVIASFPDLLTLLGWSPLSPDSSICDYFSRHVYMGVRPVHWRIWRKLFTRKLPKLTEQCWREWRPTSKNTFWNPSMKTDTLWRTLFSKLKSVKC